MIHFGRHMQILDRLKDIEHELDCGFSAEVETNLYQEQKELKEEQARLNAEEKEYREGYEAGRAYHMDGVPMKDEWLGRFGFFRQGFDAAGQDS